MYRFKHNDIIPEDFKNKLKTNYTFSKIILYYDRCVNKDDAMHDIYKIYFNGYSFFDDIINNPTFYNNQLIYESFPFKYDIINNIKDDISINFFCNVIYIDIDLVENNNIIYLKDNDNIINNDMYTKIYDGNKSYIISNYFNNLDEFKKYCLNNNMTIDNINNFMYDYYDKNYVIKLKKNDDNDYKLLGEYEIGVRDFFNNIYDIYNIKASFFLKKIEL